MSGRNVVTEHQESQLALTGTLECRPSAARRARRLVAAALDVWGLDELRGDAEQIVSELVANVVVHTNCASLRLEIRRGADGAVRIEVGDRSRVTPAPCRPGDGSESGRGLLMVEALSSRWGCDRRRRGKVVWAELTSPGGRP